MRLRAFRWMCGREAPTYLVVRRELHGGHAVDVLFDLVEEVVPAADQAALVLVTDQVQFVRVPHFSYLNRDPEAGHQ